MSDVIWKLLLNLNDMETGRLQRWGRSSDGAATHLKSVGMDGVVARGVGADFTEVTIVLG